MIELNKGTIEEIIVPVTDLLGNLTTLNGTGPTFDVYSADDAKTHVISSQAASNDGMEAHCLIDTTPSGFTAREYDLYLKFSSSPETPVVGPVRFRVNSLGQM